MPEAVAVKDSKKGNVMEWISNEVVMCGSFLACNGLIVDTNDTTSGHRLVKDQDNDSNSITEIHEGRERSSVKSSDKTVKQRGSNNMFRSILFEHSCFCDSNTVTAVSPLLKRNDSYEFERNESDAFVEGKTFVFVHEDFYG